jgi:hypothetical protein
MVDKIIKKIKIRFFWITLERFPNLFRPNSKPYISGDTFRKVSDHVFDESNSIDHRKVKKNDIVFLNPDLLEIFFNYFDKKITNKYILITHNSDRNIGNEEFSNISDNVIHWFAQNLTIEENDRISFIPIGLENLRRLKHGRKKWFRSSKKIKSNLILNSFNTFTNYEKRDHPKNLLAKLETVDTKNFESTQKYFNSLNEYMFVICPEGNGIDTHRIWESLLLKVIPILILNPFTQILKNNSVPCVYLNNWKDLENLSSIDLEKLYFEKLEKFTDQHLMFSYWINNIKSKFLI